MFETDLLGSQMPTTYAMRWCRQDREEGNGPETGKQEKKRVIGGRVLQNIQAQS